MGGFMDRQAVASQLCGVQGAPEPRLAHAGGVHRE